MDAELKTYLDEIVDRLAAIEERLATRGKKKEVEPSEAQALTNLVIELGLGGNVPADYARQCTRAKQLLKLKPVDYWEKAAAAMPQLFPYTRGDSWDVFALGQKAHLALAQGTSDPFDDDGDPYTPGWERRARMIAR